MIDTFERKKGNRRLKFSVQICRPQEVMCTFLLVYIFTVCNALGITCISFQFALPSSKHAKATAAPSNELSLAPTSFIVPDLPLVEAKRPSM